MAMPGLQQHYLIKYEIDKNVFVSSNCLFSFSAKVNCAILVYKKKSRNSRNKHFPSPFHESGKRPFHESGKRPFHATF